MEKEALSNPELGRRYLICSRSLILEQLFSSVRDISEQNKRSRKVWSILLLRDAFNACFVFFTYRNTTQQNILHMFLLTGDALCWHSAETTCDQQARRVKQKPPPYLQTWRSHVWAQVCPSNSLLLNNNKTSHISGRCFDPFKASSNFMCSLR